MLKKFYANSYGDLKTEVESSHKKHESNYSNQAGW